MARRRGPPSQGWKTFLRNHADGIAAMDLFVVPTVSFRLLYGLLIMGHSRRRILWLGVTAHPTAEWIANQLTEACGWERPPGYLIRDWDACYGNVFIRRIRSLGIRDHPTSPRSPWQNGYAERLIGSIRRECLDHVLVFGEWHLFSAACTTNTLGFDLRQGQVRVSAKVRRWVEETHQRAGSTKMQGKFKINKTENILAIAVGLLMAGGASLATVKHAVAEIAADFYRNKTLSIGVPNSAGGGYDVYARVLAHHISKHIPGGPNVVIQNLPAAGGMALANQL